MCNIVGMSFENHVKPRIKFKGFHHRGVENPSGWGVGFYPDESSQIFKEAKDEKDSPLFEQLKNYKGILSKIIIAHVRIATKGKAHHKNTHPFSRELDGIDHIFTHNGTLINLIDLPTGRFHRLGETDSEHAFCHLMHLIESRKIKNREWTKKDFEWLHKALKNINKYGSFNSIFSDGKNLFCYQDKDGFNQLQFIKLNAGDKKIKLKGTYWRISFPKDSQRKNNQGYVISTKKLTKHDWRGFKKQELAVFNDGKMIYSSSRNVSKY